MADPGSLVKVAGNSRRFCSTRSKAGRLCTTSSVEREGAGGEENVMEVLLNKFKWMREMLIVITRMCFRETITCARAGIVWTRRGGDSDLGIQQDWNKKSQSFEKI